MVEEGNASGDEIRLVALTFALAHDRLGGQPTAAYVTNNYRFPRIPLGKYRKVQP
jgi:hypothetical protein